MKITGIQCLNCEQQLYSKSVHDFVSCGCENQTFVDGGNEYVRFGGVDMMKIGYIRTIDGLIYSEVSINYQIDGPALYIARGCPGSGKSSLIQALQEQQGGKICSADHFFLTESGDYRFDAGKIGAAHRRCQDDASFAVSFKRQFVYIDNTNTKAKEARFYAELAKQNGYTITIVEPINPGAKDLETLCKRNVHGVPRETIQKMLGRFERTIEFANKLREYIK